MVARHGLNVHEAGGTTLSEYEEYSFAYAVRRQERDRESAFQAWMNQAVQAQLNKGTEKKPDWVPKYENFSEFYDEDLFFESVFNPEKVMKKIKKQEKKELTLADKNRLLSQARKEEKNG